MKFHMELINRLAEKVINSVINYLFFIFKCKLINFIHCLNVVPAATFQSILLRNIQV